MAQPAAAQLGADPVPPPVVQTTDENGIDLVSFKMKKPVAGIAIGPGGPGSLSFTVSTGDSTQGEVYGYAKISSASSTANFVVSIVIGSTTETFTSSTPWNSSYQLTSQTLTQDQGRSSTLVYDQPTDTFTYTRSDGAVAVLRKNLISGSPASNLHKIVSLTYPAGETLNYNYQYNPQTSNGFTFNIYDVLTVSSSLGYQLRFTYDTSAGWGRLASATVFNRRDVACAPAAATCSIPSSWPKLTIAANGTITDNLNRTSTISSNGTSHTVTTPAGRTFSGGGGSYSDGKGTWSYSHPTQFSCVSLITNPDHPEPRVVSCDAEGYITSDRTDDLETSYFYDPKKRVTRIEVGGPRGTAGNAATEYTYDTRGNVTQVRRISTTPGTPADIITYASYPPTCTNQKTCNKPTWTKDARGNQTDYEYDPTHGGVTSVTLPAGANGLRLKTVYGYTSLTANFLNASGQVVQGSPVYRLTSISQCATALTCAGTVNEVKTTIVYDPDEGLLPETITTGAGNNSLVAITTKTYHPTGDVQTVDGPLSGTGDTTRYYYDNGRQLTGVIGPDPDGTSSPLLRRTIQTTYNGDGLPITEEVGTTTSQSDTAMSSFVSLQQKTTVYDGQGRTSKETFSAASNAYEVTQYAYTSTGRLNCVAQRLALTSPPASACDQGSSTNDRITQYLYDQNGLVTNVKVGVGTSAVRDELVNTYDSFWRPLTVKDGKGNQTTYEYDGHGRLKKMRYPDSTNGSISSNIDFVELSYDADSNLTATRLRDGLIVGQSYDARGQRVSIDLPTIGGGDEDVSYSYDNMGRTLSVTNTAGKSASFTYDALGRVLTESSATATKSMQYDLAGRRTRLTWQDGFYVIYDRAVTGQVTKIRENGATSGVGVLATFGYDNLGRRTTLTRGNGTVTTYNWDSASRLSWLKQNLDGTSGDIQLDFTYNGANEIASRTKNNVAFDWTDQYNVSRNYTANGLNQYTTAGPSVNLTYDARGNLTSAGGPTYSYNSLNQLRSAGGTNTFTYDPLGRLISENQAGKVLDYVGTDLVTEHGTASGSPVLRRYVFGPEINEPLVWYEGSGTSNRRFLHADERGSIISGSNSTGADVFINIYDEFGIPAVTNMGRFQYTGQAWIPDLAMYYYRARIYSPTLGRFLQTDPVGYGAGMNVYAYVGNNPVNRVDPTGLSPQCTQYTRSWFWRSMGPDYPIAQFSWTECRATPGSGLQPQLFYLPNSPSAGIIGNPEGKTCYGPPPAPGTDATKSELAAQARANAAEAASHRIDFVAELYELFWFRNQVRNGGPWDYKQYHPGFQDFGNYNYGYTGSAMGISEYTLLSQAGRAQIAAGTSKPEWGSGWPSKPPYGDDPRDQDLIKRGISDRENGC